jgi:hypothetical protein
MAPGRARQGTRIWKGSVLPHASITLNRAIEAPRTVSERQPSARMGAPPYD